MKGEPFILRRACPIEGWKFIIISRETGVESFRKIKSCFIFQLLIRSMRVLCGPLGNEITLKSDLWKKIYYNMNEALFSQVSHG